MDMPRDHAAHIRVRGQDVNEVIRLFQDDGIDRQGQRVGVVMLNHDHRPVARLVQTVGQPSLPPVAQPPAHQTRFRRIQKDNPISPGIQHA